MIPDAEQVVLDTNVLVHWLRGNEIGIALRSVYRLGARRPRPVIPVVVKAEILSFAQQQQWQHAKQQALDSLLAELPVADISSEPVVAAYARLDAWSRLQGRRMGKNDLWIAALTSVLDATLITMDQDFTHLSPAHLKLVMVDESVLVMNR